MNLKILSVKDQGDLENERVVLQALADCDIGKYIVFDTTYDGDMISNELRHSYWFPDKDVKKGDKVVLYTKKGKDKEKSFEQGFKSHFFYWGLERTVWNKDEDCALLIRVAEYRAKGIRE